MARGRKIFFMSFEISLFRCLFICGNILMHLNLENRITTHPYNPESTSGHLLYLSNRT